MHDGRGGREQLKRTAEAMRERLVKTGRKKIVKLERGEA